MFSDSNNKLLFVDEPDLADRPWQRETGGELGRPLRYEFDRCIPLSGRDRC